MRTVSKTLLDLFASDAIASAFVVLLDFTMPDTTHLRFARYTSDVTYGGAVFTAWPFEATLAFGSTSGEVQTASLTIEDAVRWLRPYAIASNWFRDCTLAIRVICVAEPALDYAWSTATYDILTAVPQEERIAMELGGPNPTKLRFPSDLYWAYQCPYVRGFKADPRCGYSGAEASCDGSYATCESLGNAANFGGFLGLDEDGAKLVLPMM